MSSLDKALYAASLTLAIVLALVLAAIPWLLLALACGWIDIHLAPPEQVVLGFGAVLSQSRYVSLCMVLGDC